jgi:hypothetical protein
MALMLVGQAAVGRLSASRWVTLASKCAVFFALFDRARAPDSSRCHQRDGGETPACTMTGHGCERERASGFGP